MKPFLALIILVFTSYFAFGQTEPKSAGFLRMTETDSLYLVALEKYISELESYKKEFSKRELPKRIYLEYQDYLLKIPELIHGYEIQKIGLGNRKKVFRQNNNELVYVKVFPLTITKGRFHISLVPYLAELKKRNNLHLTYSVWTKVFFKYEDGKLKYEKTEGGGI